MSKKEKTVDWPKVLREYQQRECTQAEFCRRKGINSHTLSYHLGKKSKRKSFVPAVVEEKASTEVVLEFPGGVTLRVSS